MRVKDELHGLIEQLDEAEAEAALAHVRALLDQRPRPDGGSAHYLTVPLPDPLGTAVLTELRLGPFATDEVGQRVADALVSDIMADYLASGHDWETAMRAVCAAKYRHLIVDWPTVTPAA